MEEDKAMNALTVIENMVVLIYLGVVTLTGAGALLGTVLKWFKWAWGIN